MLDDCLVADGLVADGLSSDFCCLVDLAAEMSKDVSLLELSFFELSALESSALESLFCAWAGLSSDGASSVRTMAMSCGTALGVGLVGVGVFLSNKARLAAAIPTKISVAMSAVLWRMALASQGWRALLVGRLVCLMVRPIFRGGS